MVLALSHGIPRVPRYSGYCRLLANFEYETVTLFGGSFQASSSILEQWLMQSEPRDARTPVWALPRSIASTYGIVFTFSSSGYLDVSVHRVPSVHLWIQCTVTGSLPPGFPIQTSADHGICASPRSFSQLITSFFGSQCQGIRPAPFLA